MFNFAMFFFLYSCWPLVHHLSLMLLLVSEHDFSEAVPENQRMEHFLLSQQPMCFLSLVSWSALNMALASCLTALQLCWSHWLMSLLYLSDSRCEKCVMCLPPRDQKVLLLRARLYRQMSDGGQQDHHCRLTVWGSAHWSIIDEDKGWLPSSFYSVHIDAYIMSECGRILHKPSVLNFRPLFSSLCICID